MSLLKNIFGSSDISNIKIDWENLEHIDQLDLISKSLEKPVLIFKHSTRCSVSRMVLKQFEKEFDKSDVITPYFLDLLNHRDISNEIATKFNVMHQSPQILVIKKGICVYSETHDSIDASELTKFI